METFTSETGLVESILWIPGALLYLPAGILSAIVLLEIVDYMQKSRENDRAALVLLIFGLIASFFAAHVGALMVFLLGEWGNYPFRRLLPGYLLGLLFLAGWALKYFSRRSWLHANEMAMGHRQTKQRTSGSPFLNASYRGVLAITAVAAAACLSYKAQFGDVPAYVTLGYPGKASDMPKPPSEAAGVPQAVPVPAPAPPPKPEPEPEPAAPAAKALLPASAGPQPQPMPVGTASAIPVPEHLTIDFVKQVQPLLERSCYDCHGESEDKGDLRMHTPADIRKGGGDGPVLVAGKPEESPLYTLTTLPPDDDDIMPSKGDPLTKEETEILRQWILEGPFLADGRRVDDTSAPSGDGAAPAEGAAPDGGAQEMPLSTDVVIPNPDYLASLASKGIVITPAAAEHMLEVDYSKASLGPGEIDLKVLFPLARNIVSLDLRRTKVSDNDTAAIKEFQNLVTLRLDRTNTGDETLSNVADLPRIETLTLFATRISDIGVSQLGRLASLKELVLHNTLVTAQGANRLRESLPGAKIDAPQ